MNRPDLCPVCKKQLRWEEPGGIFNGPGYYHCPKCKYRRYEGSEPRMFFRRIRKGKRG